MDKRYSLDRKIHPQRNAMSTTPSSSNQSNAVQTASPMLEGIDPIVFKNLQLPDEANEYLRNRWLREIFWFARATRRSRRIFFWLSGASIVSSSLTALLAGVSVNSTSELTRWVVALLGLVSAISTGLLALFQAWANWKRRSTTLERLKSEGRQFLVLTGEYAAYQTHQEAFVAFVPKIEAIIAEHKTEFFAKSPEVSGAKPSKMP